MKVLFASYQAVAMPGGGVYTQIMKTKAALEKAGVQVDLFDQWKRYNWQEIDLVHVFSTDMRNYFLLKALPAEVPLVVSPIIDKTLPFFLLRGLVATSALLPHQILTSYQSHRLGFEKARLIIAPSPDGQRMLEKGFGVSRDKIRVIYNGVDPLFLDASGDVFTEKYGFDNFVLYAGQIGNPRKNLTRLLRVAQQMPEHEFVLIGPILDNPEARRVVTMAENLPNVHLLGRVSLDELASAYAACQVFVLPSLVEGTGLVALEAGLTGANVVITKNGGPPDYFQEFAIYVDPKSETSIKQGIEAALTLPRNDELRRYIQDNFLWSKIVQKLIQVYEEVVVS